MSSTLLIMYNRVNIAKLFITILTLAGTINTYPSKFFSTELEPGHKAQQYS